MRNADTDHDAHGHDHGPGGCGHKPGEHEPAKHSGCCHGHEHGKTVGTVKARELAGASDMLFIRNSENGQIQCRTNSKAIELNAALHAHN